MVETGRKIGSWLNQRSSCSALLQADMMMPLLILLLLSVTVCLQEVETGRNTGSWL
jgi:hypothetical protein